MILNILFKMKIKGLNMKIKDLKKDKIYYMIDSRNEHLIVIPACIDCFEIILKVIESSNRRYKKDSERRICINSRTWKYSRFYSEETHPEYFV